MWFSQLPVYTSPCSLYLKHIFKLWRFPQSGSCGWGSAHVSRRLVGISRCFCVAGLLQSAAFLKIPNFSAHRLHRLHLMKSVISWDVMWQMFESKMGPPTEDRARNALLQVAFSNEPKVVSCTSLECSQWDLALEGIVFLLVFFFLQAGGGISVDQSWNVDLLCSFKRLYAYQQSPDSPIQHYLHTNTKSVARLMQHKHKDTPAHS